MADTFSVEVDTKEVEKMLSNILKKVENPKPLLKMMQKLVHALTMKMFIGKRPDNGAVRGVRWPKLAASTIQSKRAKVKRGKAVVADRPMVETARLRDSLRIISDSKKGFVYGTQVKTKKGFNYPGHHNKGRFPFIFLSVSKDLPMFSKAAVDFLKGKLKNYKSYMRV